MTTVLEEIKADFEAKNPDYKVKLVSYGDYNTLRDTITSAIAGGIAPTAAQTIQIIYIISRRRSITITR